MNYKSYLPLFLIGVCLFFSSCNNTQDINPQGDLLNLTVSDTYYHNLGWTIDEAYFFLTDTKGNQIGELIEVKDGVSNYIIERPEGFTDERISLHEVIIDTYGFEIRTFASILPGSYKRIDEADQGERASLDINFKNIPTHEFYHVASGYFSENSKWRSRQLPEIYNAQVYKEKAYLYLGNGNTGYYKFMDGLKNGQTNEVSLSDMSSDMTLYQVPEGYDEFNVTLFGEDNDIYGEHYSVYNFGDRVDHDDRSFHLPNNRSVFFTSTGLVEFSGATDYKIFQEETLGAIPSSITKINADFTITNPDMDNMEINTSGHFDFVNLAWRWDWDDLNKRTIWNLYSKDGVDITKPQIPEILKNKGLELKPLGQTWFNADLTEASHAQNFDDIISLAIGEKSRGYYDGMKYIRSVSISELYDASK